MAVHRSAGVRTEFTLDVGALARLAREIGKINPVVAKSLRAELRAAADDVVKDAKDRISPFSSKIPATIKRTGSGTTLKITAGGSAAPYAPAFENSGTAGTFRHPVFGSDTWVAQKAHPFLRPALAAQSEKLAIKIDAAIDHAMSSLRGD